MEAGGILEDRLGGAGEVGRAAEEFRHHLCDGVHDDLARVARCDRFGIMACGEDGNLFLPAVRHLRRDRALILCAEFGIGLPILCELRLPREALLLALLLALIPVGLCFLGYVEAFVFRPAEVLLGRLRRLGAERLPMHAFCARLGAAVADHRAHADERGPGSLRLGCVDRGFERNKIVAIRDHLDVPVVRLESHRHIFGEAELGGAIERDEVVVVQQDELAQAKGSGKRARLMRDALHEVAITAEDEGMVIDWRVIVFAARGIASLVVDRGEMFLRDRQTHCLSEPLAEGSGSDFNARRLSIFRVSRSMRTVLAELLQLLHRQVEAGQMQRAIEQCRGVAVRQDEAITIRPERLLWVELHELGVEQVRDRRAAKRCSGMA